MTSEIDALRESIPTLMSPKRALHTLEVERAALRLGELYCKDSLHILSAAALLHDITKEYTVDEHMAILAAHGIEPSVYDTCSPKTLHARTAALVIPERYPELALPEVISAVRWHTTGHGGMTLTEKLIYLADYIDMSRTFPDCVTLRSLFWSAEPELMSPKYRLLHLDRVIVRSFDMTAASLIEGGELIVPEMLEARNALLITLMNNPK